MIPVSVIMSVYNTREDFLRKSIDSVLCQTLQDFEFIIINDGATDDTASILRKYASKDPRIRLIRQDNAGLTAALNRGIRIAQGRYVARQDADDFSCPTRFESQYQFFESHHQLMLLGTDFVIIDDKGDEVATIRNSKVKDLKQKLRKSNPFVHGSLMFRRFANGERVSYDEFYRKSQDYDLVLRLSELGEIRILGQLLYTWRFSRYGIAQSGDTSYGERALYNYRSRRGGKKEDYSEIGLRMSRMPEAGHYEASLGLKLLAGEKYGRARKHLLRAWLKTPLNRRHLLYLFYSLLPGSLIRRIRYG